MLINQGIRGKTARGHVRCRKGEMKPGRAGARRVASAIVLDWSMGEKKEENSGEISQVSFTDEMHRLILKVQMSLVLGNFIRTA